jgi:hypothetical protein
VNVQNYVIQTGVLLARPLTSANALRGGPVTALLQFDMFTPLFSNSCGLTRYSGRSGMPPSFIQAYRHDESHGAGRPSISEPTRSRQGQTLGFRWTAVPETTQRQLCSQFATAKVRQRLVQMLNAPKQSHARKEPSASTANRVQGPPSRCGSRAGATKNVLSCQIPRV